MQSTACHYQCQNTHTCDIHLWHTSVTHTWKKRVSQIYMACSCFVSSGGRHNCTQPGGHTSSTYTLLQQTHTAFTAHRLPQHTHTAFTAHTLPQQTHTPPLLHTGFLNIHTTFTAHRLQHTPPLLHTGFLYTPPLLHTGFLNIHTPPCSQSTEIH